MTIRLWLHQVVGYHCVDFQIGVSETLILAFPIKENHKRNDWAFVFGWRERNLNVAVCFYYDLANLVKQRGAPYFTWENILWSSAT